MAEIKNKLLQALGERLLFSESLNKYTTWQIGGPAKYFYLASSNEELVLAVTTAKRLAVPYVVIGGGSNLLVADQGFDGLVIKAQNSKIKINHQPTTAEINAEAGLPLARLVGEAAGNQLTGLEWAVGIPGTVGGAVRGNAGAFTHSFSEVIKSVDYLRNGKLKKATAKECKFAYRQSLFKGDNTLTIIGVTIDLKIGQQAEILAETKKFMAQRKRSYPPLPNAGCVFKNVIITPEITEQLRKIKPELLELVRGDKLPAAVLIDSCGLKGKQLGQVQVWSEHANYILNLGGGTAEQVITLISYVKQQVRDRFGVQLQEEIEQLGF